MKTLGRQKQAGKMKKEGNIMIIRSMRWGHDHSPIEWSRLVEIRVTTEDGHEYYIIDSRYDTFEQIAVSTHPLFEAWANLFEGDDDPDKAIEKLHQLCSELYDYEMSEVPPEMSQSRFAKAIQLVRGAMQYYVDHDGDDDCQTADEYIAPYLRGELNSMKLLELVMDEDGVWTVE